MNERRIVKAWRFVRAGGPGVDGGGGPVRHLPERLDLGAGLGDARRRPSREAVEARGAWRALEDTVHVSLALPLLDPPRAGEALRPAVEEE